jgi:tetratricopeptide (TPR) repeat protein
MNILERAIAAYRAGNLDGTQELCDRILKLTPRHPSALHLMGVALVQSGQPAEGIPFLQQSVALRPRDADAQMSLGVAFEQLGRLEEATLAYERAIALKPDVAALHFNLGNAQRALRRHESALSSYQRALQIQPAWADALFNLAATLQDLSRRDEAIAVLQRLVATSPDYIDGHLSLGNALLDAKRAKEAAVAFGKILASRPNCAEAHLSLGNAWAMLGQMDEALESYQRAASSRQDYAEAWLNIGNTLRRLGRVEEAVSHYQKAVSLNPRYAEAHSNLGVALRDLRRPLDALAHYRQAIALEPGNTEASWNQALAQLSLGQYADGWRGYEMRWRRKHIEKLPDHSCPIWLGETPIQGKSLLIQHEQGLGDTIQMSRYIRQLLAQETRCVIQVPRTLLGLLARSFPGALVCDTASEPGQPDYRIPMMSLPLAMGTLSETTIPRFDSYLKPDPLKVAEWSKVWQLGCNQRVGLVWRGNPEHDNDHNRSLKLPDLAPLIESNPAVHFVSLQKHLTAIERNLLSQYRHVLVLDSELADFEDTAAAMANLDLVISVDSAPAHLAGALGVQTWLLLCGGGEWRWLLNRSDTPWYPAVTLFRQSAMGNWSKLVTILSLRLKTENPTPASLPAAPGR